MFMFQHKRAFPKLYIAFGFATSVRARLRFDTSDNVGAARVIGDLWNRVR